jgi:putative transposase
MPHDVRSIEVFTEDGWLCTACPQDELTREQADALIAQRREAAREMGRRKAAASRKARARIAPLTATGTVQDITAIAIALTITGRPGTTPRAGSRSRCSDWPGS